MSNYANLKSAIQSVIKTNGNNEITGQLLQTELLAMINTLGYGYQFMGIANPNTVPGTPDAKVFYLAYTAGTYTNFGGIVVSGFCALKYDTTWTKEDIPIGGGGVGFTLQEDDLQFAGGQGLKLMFANRINGVNIDSGLDYFILREDVSFQNQVTVGNTIYEIRYDFDLNGQTVILPSNVKFIFNGGKIYNGKLQGKILNTEFDLKDFGIVYDNPSLASQNRNYLDIISLITSDINLIVSGNVSLSGNEITLSTPLLSFRGINDALISLSSFDGISAKRILANNLSVSSSAASILFKIPSFEGAGTFRMYNCKFTGDIRVLSSLQYAEDLQHYIDTFVVRNCIFESVHYSGGVNTLFMLLDNIVVESEIIGNVVHNSTSIIFDLAITNSSTYESIIPTSNRVLRAINNIFYNDLTFKPWDNPNITQPGAYMCFILMENGQCYVRNNLFKNILANNADCACYDNYLSVHYLSYENNIWENNGNLTGEYVLLMKSKTGANGFRYYKDNTYLLTDLSTELGVEDKRGTTEPQMFVPSSTMDFVEISGNKIQMSGIYCNPYLYLTIKNFVFKNNKLLFDSFVQLTGAPCLFALTTGMVKWEISNNYVELTGSNTSEIYFIGTAQTTFSGGELFVNDNVLIGFTGICGNNNNNDIGVSVSCENNIVRKGNTVVSSPFIFYGRYAKLNLRQNLFEFGSTAPIINGISKVSNITIDLKTHTSGVAIYAFRSANRFPSGIYAGIVTVRNKATNEIRKCQLNFQNNNGTLTYVAYNAGGALNTNLQSGDSVFSKGGGSAGLFGAGLNIQGMLATNTVYEINICIKEISNINVFEVIPDSVATVDRPTLLSSNAGFSLLDKTLGKPIWWNGTGWVDATGATV